MKEQSYHIKTDEGVRVKKSALLPFIEENYKLDDLLEVSQTYIFEDDKFIGTKRLFEFSWWYFIRDKENSKKIINNYLKQIES